jgi:hypothetical protein
MKKVDIYMTLLEDGRASYDDFVRVYHEFIEKNMRNCLANQEHASLNYQNQFLHKQNMRIRMLNRLHKKYELK